MKSATACYAIVLQVRTYIRLQCNEGNCVHHPSVRSFGWIKWSGGGGNRIDGDGGWGRCGGSRERALSPPQYLESFSILSFEAKWSLKLATCRRAGLKMTAEKITPHYRCRAFVSRASPGVYWTLLHVQGSHDIQSAPFLCHSAELWAASVQQI